MKERVALGAADWLTLAAAPIFVLMAVVTAFAGDSHAAAMCGQGGQSSLLSGMGPMYLLMAAVHLAPWLSLTRNS